MGVSVYCPLNVLCFFFYVFVCVCVCVMSNQSTSKKAHHVSDLSKLDALFHKTHIKVLRLDMCTSMMPLSIIAHQMRHDHPFSQRTRQQNEQWRWELEATGQEWGWTKFEKGGGRQYREGGVFIK